MPDNPQTNFSVPKLLFPADTDRNDAEVRFEHGTFWVTQQTMAELLGVDCSTVAQHLSSIHASGELDETETSRDFLHVRNEEPWDVRRPLRYYCLDAIIAVSYRVDSVQAIQFRQWTTKALRQFTLRGYALDRDRLEAGPILAEGYFEQLMEQIREIRLSERGFHQKLTDIYATAADYQPDSPSTKQLFAKVHRLHDAVEEHDAGEPILRRSDNGSDDPGDRESMIEECLDLAESRAQRGIPTTMQQWSDFLDQMLTLDRWEYS